MRKFKRRMAAGLLAVMLALSSVGFPVSATEYTDIQVNVVDDTEAATEAAVPEPAESSEEQATADTAAETTEDLSTEVPEETTTSEETTQTEEDTSTEEESEIIDGADDAGVKVYFDESGDVVVDIPESALMGMLDAYGADLKSGYTWERLDAPHKNKDTDGIFNCFRNAKYEKDSEIIEYGKDHKIDGKNYYELALNYSGNGYPVKNKDCTVTENGETKKAEFPIEWYAIGRTNKVGNFLTEHFSDNQGKTHGCIHLVENFYKQTSVKYDLYVYPSDKKNADGTKVLYYFVRVYGKVTGTKVNTGFPDIITYCVQYGEPIRYTTTTGAASTGEGDEINTNTASMESNEAYNKLEQKDQHKVALAIFWGPHYKQVNFRDQSSASYKNFVNGSGRTTYANKLTRFHDTYGDDVKFSDPSTWTKKLYCNYVAVQLYIWEITGAEGFDAAKTAVKLDKQLGTTGNISSVANCLKDLKNYIATAETVPSFTAKGDRNKSTSVIEPEKDAKVSKTSLKLQNVTVDGKKIKAYAVTQKDTKKVLSNAALKKSKLQITVTDGGGNNAWTAEQLEAIKSGLKINVAENSFTVYVPETVFTETLKITDLSSKNPLDIRLAWTQNQIVNEGDLGQVYFTSDSAQNEVSGTAEPADLYAIADYKLQTGTYIHLWSLVFCTVREV